MIYIYIDKDSKGNYKLSGYDCKTGRDLWERKYVYYTKCDALASFRDYYDIKGRHAEIVNLTNYARA